MNSPPVLSHQMPGEWEPHEATWIGWPHNDRDWPGRMGPVPWAYGEIVRKVAIGERVRLLVHSEPQAQQAQHVLMTLGVDLSLVDLIPCKTDRGWTRDVGAIFVKGQDATSPLVAVSFKFNGWAKYDDWDQDILVPEQMARYTGCSLVRAQFNGRDVVLEGGSVDANGRGTLLTTEECLLDRHVQPRNPDLSRRDIETVLLQYLGATNVLWLGRGIVGDDTHGHVDDICRFVNRSTVVLCRESNSRDDNYRLLEENHERLQGMRLEDGARIEVVPIPMPEPLVYDGQRVPASYANFYITNGSVLVPTFNDARDREALGILAELFPDRKVVGVHCGDLIWGLGAIHCLTQQQPVSGLEGIR